MATFMEFTTRKNRWCTDVQINVISGSHTCCKKIMEVVCVSE